MVSPARLRRARLAVSATFLLVGTLSATWAARVPAVEDDLGLSNGQLAVVFPATSRAGGGRSTAKAALVGWLGGWSGRILLLGALAFTVELAQSGGTYWGAIYLRDGLGSSPSAAAAGVAVFLAAMLAGDRLRGRLGPVRLFRAGALVAGAGFGGACSWIRRSRG